MNKLILLLSLLTGISTTSIGQGKAGKPQRQIIDSDTLQLIDLAQPVTSTTLQVTNGKPFKIRFINLAPKVQYVIRGETMVNLLPSLNLPSQTNTNNSQHLPASIPETSSRCDELKDLLEKATSETEVSKLLAEGAGTTGCNINDIYAGNTIYEYPKNKSIKLHNETLTIVITNTVTKTSWTFIFKTKSEGEFFTTYGFTFIPLVLGKPHTYYAQQQPGATPAAGQPTPPTTYNITESANADHFNYAPTIMFHYINYKDKSWSGSWTAGLGINLNASNNSNSISPLVVAGYSLLYHQNIGVSFGFAGHTVSNLKGNYSTNVPITTNLESTDLNRQVIVVNPFISITFRFSSNPNKGSSDSVPNTPATTP